MSWSYRMSVARRSVENMSTQQQARPSNAGATEIRLRQIGLVQGGRDEIREDEWADESSTIVLDSDLFEPDATLGLKAFSHLEVVFYFHLSTRVRYGAAHPRSNPAWPRVGVLADHTPHRPNHLGVSVCELLSVDGLELSVRGLDAIDGTPVLDVKPYVEEFGPRGQTREPAWIRDLMRSYY